MITNGIITLPEQMRPNIDLVMGIDAQLDSLNLACNPRGSIPRGGAQAMMLKSANHHVEMAFFDTGECLHEGSAGRTARALKLPEAGAKRQNQGGLAHDK